THESPSADVVDDRWTHGQCPAAAVLRLRHPVPTDDPVFDHERESMTVMKRSGCIWRRHRHHEKRFCGIAIRSEDSRCGDGRDARSELPTRRSNIFSARSVTIYTAFLSAIPEGGSYG